MAETSIESGILAAIGNTPLVPLRRLFPGCRARLFAKLEMMNPMGSAKDRAAASMLSAAIRQGLVVPGQTTIVESTSGNMGVALAFLCRSLGLPLICVVDGRLTPQNRGLMRALGATLDEVTQPDPETGDLLPARLKRVRSWLETIRPSYWPDQYRNEANALAHRGTCAEIIAQLGGPPDALLCAAGTCGTLRGCSDHLAATGASTSLIAVDAVGSRIFGQAPRRRLIPGLGSAIRPPLVEGARIEQVIHVQELDAIHGSRLLLQAEALLAGGSSGAVVAALARQRAWLQEDRSIVLLLPDDGARYLDTVFDDRWVVDHFGGLPSGFSQDFP